MTRYSDYITGDLFAVGGIEFGPHRLQGTAGDVPAGYVSGYITALPQTAAVPGQEFVLLLELFEADGNSARLYWSGKSNRIDVTPRGITVTYNVHAARKIPLLHRDIAEALTDALNKVRVGEGLTRQWRVVEHGFMS
jgi:hypothetical protein